MEYEKRKNYLTKNYKSDEWYTPVEVVNFITTIVENGKKIICPFDSDKSEFVKAFPDSIHNIEDFMEKQYDYDICVTNPPFSLGDKVVRRCLSENKDLILVFPSTAIFSVTFYKLIKEFRFNYKIYSPEKRIYFIDEKGNQNRPNFHSVILQIDKNFTKNEIIHFDLKEYVEV